MDTSLIPWSSKFKICTMCKIFSFGKLMQFECILIIRKAENAENSQTAHRVSVKSRRVINLFGLC